MCGGVSAFARGGRYCGKAPRPRARGGWLEVEGVAG